MNMRTQKKAGNKTRSIANSVTQKQSGSGSAFQFVDNRPETTTQRKLQSIMNNSPQVRQLKVLQERINRTQAKKMTQPRPMPKGNKSGSLPDASIHRQGVKQCYQVADDHIRGDLRHPKANTLFEDDTIDDIKNRLPGNSITTSSNVLVDAAVRASRGDGEMDYSVLSTRKVTSEKQVTSFLDEKAEDEHMYVLDRGALHVAIRADGKKLPHPTLVGGDPDVEGAGAMRWGSGGEVIVDDGSGHFRPKGAAAVKKVVDKIMEKASKNFAKKVKKGKRR